MFRTRADVRPVATVAAVVTLGLVPFLVPMPGWGVIAYALVHLYLRSYCPYAQHNQGHLSAFSAGPGATRAARAAAYALNRLYDVLLTQCTGYPTALWSCTTCAAITAISWRRQTTWRGSWISRPAGPSRAGATRSWAI